MRAPLLLALPLAFVFACGGAAPPAEPTPPPPAAPTPEPPPPAPAKPQGAFACCEGAPLVDLLTAYLDVHKALAADDAGKAAAALGTLAARADAAKAAPGLDDPSKGFLATIGSEAQGASTGAIADQRAAFKKISPAMVSLARAHQGGERSVTEAWCPMAEGAWLQEGSTISNPYEGANMPTCGSFR